MAPSTFEKEGFYYKHHQDWPALCSQSPWEISDVTPLTKVYLGFLLCLVLFSFTSLLLRAEKMTPSLKQWFEKREKATSDSRVDKRGHDLPALCRFWLSCPPKPTLSLTSWGSHGGGSPAAKGLLRGRRAGCKLEKWAWCSQPGTGRRMRRPSLDNLDPDKKRASWPGSNDILWP